jgi:hypothetical protein
MTVPPASSPVGVDHQPFGQSRKRFVEEKLEVV